MEHDDRDDEEFFEALAGRRARGSGASALRDALAAQARTLREAEAARAEDLSAEERARMDSLGERLRAAGAFRSAVAAALPARAPLLQRLRDLLLGESWRRPLAIAAGVVVATALGVRLAGVGEPDESSVIRGGGTPAIVVADPDAQAGRLERELVAAGAKVGAVKVSAREWALVVEVPDRGRLPEVQRLLHAAGFAIAGEPPYELAVRGR
jgi:hypothetical protein